MGSRNNPGKFDCYNLAEPDEPMFVLLARDPVAIPVIAEWINRRQELIDKGNKPASDMEKLAEARECMISISQWRKKHRSS